MTQRYVVVDLETTGNSVKKGDKIIQFAAVVVENGKIIEEYSTFLNPEQDLSPFIEELTGIKQQQLETAPLFVEVAPKIIELLEEACFVAHNVLFDLSFLQDELMAAGYAGFYGSTIDTVELSKILRPSAASFKLSHLAKEEGFIHDRPHQADSDAYATAELFILFSDELKKIPLVTLKQLYKLSQSLKSEISELISTILEERMTKSPLHHPYLQIHKGIAIRKPVDKTITNRMGDYCYPESAQEKTLMLNEAFLNPEVRQDQLTMMDKVYDIISNEKLALIEAGTGLGKTLGYLLPSAYFAIQKKEKVIISTYTIELQNQLLHKELPHLQAMLPFPIQTVVLKGRSNYISLAKFDRVLRTRDDNYDSSLAKMQILIWLLQTETGDKDELNLTSGGELFWEKLQSGSHLASEHQASWQHLDFYERAKLHSKQADLIITNHAYLMTDYFSNRSNEVIGSTIIIDEAHQLDNAALKHLGSSIDYVGIKMMMNKLGSIEQKLLLYKLEKMLTEINFNKSCRQLESQIQESIFELDQFFHMLSAICEKMARENSLKQAVNLKEIIESNHNSKALKMIVERIVNHFKELSLFFQESIQNVMDKGQPGKTQLFYLTEIDYISNYFHQYSIHLKEYFLNPKEDVLYWMEWNKNGPSQYVYLYSQPILAGRDLWLRFFSQQRSIVLTSSTLTVKGSFQYMMDKLGLTPEKCETFSFPSPFAYKEKVQLLIAADLPEVNKVSNEEYSESIASYIVSAALACKGRMLILFTSQDMLKTTNDLLRNNKDLVDFNILSQGISSNSKTRLIKYFQNFDKSILLGTASFWDGLDLPGETLQCLMIVRLPFPSPIEPINEARCKRIEETGGNSFIEYALPEAIMRFRQGFGRLIRTKEDKGVFIVCDKRISTTKYGRDFLGSIPEISTKKVELSQIQEMIKSWLN